MRFLILAALPACVVVRPPELSERPRWRIAGDDTLDAECVLARALVRKSGKEGIGLTIALHSRGDCDFTPTTISLQLATGTSVALAAPPPTVLHGRSLLYAWFPLAFDNNAAWNAGARAGTLAIGYTIAGKPGTWTIAMVQQ